MYFLLCTLSVVCHPPPFLNEIVSLCVCVCVCVREREREREKDQSYQPFYEDINLSCY